MKPSRETEIKLSVRDRRKAAKRLAELGFQVVRKRHWESNFVFDFPDRRLRKARSLLRLRSAAGEHLLTFKGPPQSSRRYARRTEIETRVEDGALLHEVLKKLGLKPVFVYEKFRTVYAAGRKTGHHETPHAAYDETPIGDYLELEGPENWIDRVATQLGYAPPDYITNTYLDLYNQWCRQEGRKAANMVFRQRAPSARPSRVPNGK
jgi:adenylate cyclase class 2